MSLSKKKNQPWYYGHGFFSLSLFSYLKVFTCAVFITLFGSCITVKA